jgi:hypothetical protein
MAQVRPSFNITESCLMLVSSCLVHALPGCFVSTDNVIIVCPPNLFLCPLPSPGQLSELSRTVSQQRASLVEWENKGRDMLKRVEDADKMVQTYKVHPFVTTEHDFQDSSRNPLSHRLD